MVCAEPRLYSFSWKLLLNKCRWPEWSIFWGPQQSGRYPNSDSPKVLYFQSLTARSDICPHPEGGKGPGTACGRGFWGRILDGGHVFAPFNGSVSEEGL